MEVSKESNKANEEFPAPTFKIGKFYYTYKDKNNKGYSYTCKFKKKCSFTITIYEPNLKNISNNKSDKIEYFITSKKYPSHTCEEIIAENDISNKKVITEEKSFTKADIEKMARILINQNLELKPLWHKINLNKNNIILPLTKIRIYYIA